MNIRTTHDSERERTAAAQLSRLLEQHDLSRWCFTDVVRIEAMVVARSHPVLRLNTRHLNDDDQALSTFLHEQLHWWLYDRPGTDTAIEEVRQRWPDPPGMPDGGATNASSTWLHLVLCPLEMAAVETVLGHDLPAEARATGPYSWIYREIAQDRAWFDELLRRHDLELPDAPAEPMHWEPLRDLAPHGLVLFGEPTQPNAQIGDLIASTHAQHPTMVVGERDVVVDGDRPTGMHPGLTVGAEHLDDPAAFALVYAFAQAAFWTSADAQVREVIGRLPADVVEAVGGRPFGPSTVIAGTVALDALGDVGLDALPRTPLAARLSPLLPHLPEVRQLLEPPAP